MRPVQRSRSPKIRERSTSSVAFKKICVVTALHYGVNRDRSSYKASVLTEHKFESSLAKIIDNLHQIFILVQMITATTGLPVEIISNENVDIDLCILSTCEHVIFSAGGFSKLCQKLQVTHKSTPSQVPPPQEVKTQFRRDMFFV